MSVQNQQMDPISHITEQLQNICALPGVEAALVYRQDAAVISSLTSNSNSRNLAETLLWLKSTVLTAARDIMRSNLRKSIHEVFDKGVLLYPLGVFGLLAVIAEPEANLGLLMIEVRRKAAQIVEGVLYNDYCN